MAALAAPEPTRISTVDLTARYKLPPTREGRHIVALRIASKGGASDGKTVIFSGLHGHELGPPSLALVLAERLAAEGKTASIGEVWVVPVVNPDGYEYSRVPGHYGRKNGGWAGGGEGVDLNRNFPTGWGTKCGGSRDPKADDFFGPGPATEVETRTVLAVVKEQSFTRALDLHAWGRGVMWGGGCGRGGHSPRLKEAALRFAKAAKYDPVESTYDGVLFEHLAASGVLAFSLETFFFTFDPASKDIALEADQLWPAVRQFVREPGLKRRSRFSCSAIGGNDGRSGEGLVALVILAMLGFRRRPTSLS
jgi:MYXO-CTERM domain-containing protein